MKRYGQIIELKPERKEEYVKLHSRVWPDVLKRISASKIRNYSIYLKDLTLFSYFEYVGEDFDADMARMAADPEIQHWWDACKPCMLPMENREEGEWWADMEEIFHHD